MRPLLYTFVLEKTLKSMVETFYSCIHLSIQVIDEQGNFIAESSEKTEFCQCLQKYLTVEDSCERMHVSASKKAISLGEPYIFDCHAGLNHIVFPLINNKTFLGSILIGPFLMDEADSLLISKTAKRYQISTVDALELYDAINTISIVAPTRVTHISRLVYYLFSNLINEGKKELKLNNQKLLQQSLINESIQRYKAESIHTGAYPYDKEKALINKVKLGDKEGASATLNDLLGYVFFSEGNSLEIIKPRSIELCSLLSRAAIEGGAPADNILKLNNQFLKNIEQVSTLDTLCFKLQEIVECFSESLFDYTSTQNSEGVKKALIYIAKHFNENLTLDQVAQHANMHPSYFSTKFKQVTGSSFKEHLNMVRIEESKRLLINTDFSIIDIAISVGFEDQSYFSKVFRKYTGMTPKQFR